MVSNCAYCSSTIKHPPSQSRKYCNRKCQYLGETSIKFARGEYTFDSVKTWKKYTEPYECSECKINSWNGKSLTLHCDHIDGDRKNNHIDNLRWLCPNCHSQTDTWCIRNESQEGRERRLESYKRNLATKPKFTKRT